MKRNRQDLLPSPTFVKGFLNAYAKYVGLDANEIMLRYQRGLTGTPENVPDATPEKEPGQDGKPRRVVVAWIAGGVVVAGLIVCTFLFFQPSGTRIEPLPPPAAEKARSRRPRYPPRLLPKSQSPLPPRKSFRPHLLKSPERLPRSRNRLLRRQFLRRLRSRRLHPPLPKIAATLLPQKGKPISLQLKAVELTWVSVKADNQAEREMMLRPGETIPLEAVSQMVVLVGNAGGLDLIYNGKTLERFGKSGDVVALTFTPGGLDVKRIEKSKPQ